MTYILMFVAKILDSFLATQEKIALNNGLKVKTAILAFVTKAIGLLLMAQVLVTMDLIGIAVICFAHAIGRYVSMTFTDKRKTDEQYLYIVTPKYPAGAKAYADRLRAAGMFPELKQTYRDKGKKALEITVVANNKAQTTVVKDAMPKLSAWRRVTTGIQNDYYTGGL